MAQANGRVQVPQVLRRPFRVRGVEPPRVAHEDEAAVRFEEDAGVGVHAKVAEKAAQAPGRKQTKRTRQSGKHGNRDS